MASQVKGTSGVSFGTRSLHAHRGGGQEGGLINPTLTEAFDLVLVVRAMWPWTLAVSDCQGSSCCPLKRVLLGLGHWHEPGCP